MANREPLPYGTTIRYRGAVAVVIDDAGGDTLEVECEGYRQRWRWEFEGMSCTVVEKQETGNEQTFDNWLHREDYGSHEQLRRCWDAAAQDAYERAAVVAGAYLDGCRQSLTEDVGQRIARDIRALAAREAGKEDDNGN